MADNNSTLDIPSKDDATPSAKKAMATGKDLFEGALISAGIESGGAVVPVVGETAGGLLATLLLGRDGAKTYGHRRTGEEMMKRLLM